MTKNISIKYGTEHLNWLYVCEIFKLAPLGTRDPEKLQLAAENSQQSTILSYFRNSKDKASAA
jgi:diadenosine tetraphosphatase ApaH/serine/threonine PP2A family protein phosphatase